MTTEQPQDTDRTKKDFQAESEELLDGISMQLRELEHSLTTKQPKPEVINAVFRGIHSLKGLSGMLGYAKISQLTHDLENLLDELRMGKISLSHQLIDFLYDCLDALNVLTIELTDPSMTDDFQIMPLLRRIEEFLEERKGEDSHTIFDEIELDPNIIKVLTEYEEYRLSDNIRRRVNLFSLIASFNFETFDEELTRLNGGLREIGEIITTLPSIEPISETEIQFNLILGTEYDEEKLDELFSVFALKIQRIPYTKPSRVSDMPGNRQEKSAAAVTAGTTAQSASGSENQCEPAPDADDAKEQRSIASGKTVRVSLEKIDGVLNMIGELAITRSVIDQIARDLRDYAGFHQAYELLKINRGLEKQIMRLQTRILEIRMVPLDQLFSRLSRNIAKLARDIDKSISLHIVGEETELDKMIIEELSDPLLHILRNAIDHGIENADDRVRLGKSAEGNVWIQAYQKGNYVIIEVRDDGRGLDVDAIRKKAITSGLMQKDERIRTEDLFQFIFLPGFSTRDKASTLSGRGVGMDVVRKNISMMNGTIRIYSQPDQGTTFVIGIPITMAVISAMLVQIAGEKYAIPLTSIIRSITYSADKVSSIEGKEVINFNELPIPLIRLRHYFSLTETNGHDRFAVLVHSAEKRAALVVDQLLGRQDIVIKSLGKRLQNFPGIAGGTEIGDKRAILVLDVASLLDSYVVE